MQLDESKLKFTFSKKLQTICLALVGIGLALTLLQLALPWHAHHAAGEAAAQPGAHTPMNPRFFLSVHLALMVALPLALGGIFFVAFNHVAGSAWCVSIRRVAENYFWYLPVVLVLMIVVFIGLGDVFGHWVHGASDDRLLNVKKPWLNPSFFVGRNLFWVVLWAAFGFFLWKQSVAQDTDGQVSRTKRMANISAAFCVVFGLSISASAWDLGMSLEPHWFSTMFAVYIFAGLGLTVYSSLVIWGWYLKRTGHFGDSFNENHLHDLGKYLWGFSNFWAYVAFSQGMLIWYAHIPEETFFFKTRITNGWEVVSTLLVISRFILPFYLIIRRDTKRNINWMAGVSAFIIFGQVLDMYWLAYPTLDHGQFVWPSWHELGPLLFVFGSFVLVVGKALERQSLVPKKDPRLEECLHWHQ